MTRRAASSPSHLQQRVPTHTKSDDGLDKLNLTCVKRLKIIINVNKRNYYDQKITNVSKR